MQETTEQIRNFLQFIALQFISHPEDAQLKVAEVSEDHIRFRLVLNKADVAILIGRNGFTASAIRNVLKAAAIRDGINATLQIVSHDEERQRLAAIEAGQTFDDEIPVESTDEADDETLEESS
ncbi:KH domain-containing protein [Rubritalea spongiae]|uniref:KH domain-containing protein n=1 Tax=Rubritalea spongiae TaxID=430797 RepID=A0ABW5E2T5_9BACT